MKSSILGRVLTRLFALFGMTLTCVACYGTPYEEYRFDYGVNGRVVDDKGDGIPGIWVSGRGHFTISDDSGHFYFEGVRHNPLVIDFLDVDGEENGGEFLERSVDITEAPTNYIDMGDVVLLRADKEEDKSEE